MDFAVMLTFSGQRGGGGGGGKGGSGGYCDGGCGHWVVRIC